MKVILGISSSISAYKSPMLVRALVKRGAQVFCALTENAAKLVATKALETVSGNRVIQDVFNEKDPLTHINLSKEADLLLIAPATANLIGKLAAGIADDAITTIALAFTGRKLIAPAMNTNMWESPQVRKNIAFLRNECGYDVIEPGQGELACEDEGVGRLADIDDIAYAALKDSSELQGMKAVVSSGATIEWIDDIRYITNSSSGKMGRAIAQELIRRGAEVSYVQGDVRSTPPQGAKLIEVETTQQMQDAVIEHSRDADILVMAAAPLDFRPKERIDGKVKKKDIELIELTINSDILKATRNSCPGLFITAFAAEHSDLMKNAEAKMKAKGADMIVANEIKDSFKKDVNKISVILKNGKVSSYEEMPKTDCAQIIVKHLMEEIEKGKGQLI